MFTSSVANQKLISELFNQFEFNQFEEEFKKLIQVKNYNTAHEIFNRQLSKVSPTLQLFVVGDVIRIMFDMIQDRSDVDRFEKGERIAKILESCGMSNEHTKIGHVGCLLKLHCYQEANEILAANPGWKNVAKERYDFYSKMQKELADFYGSIASFKGVPDAASHFLLKRNPAEILLTISPAERVKQLMQWVETDSWDAVALGLKGVLARGDYEVAGAVISSCKQKGLPPLYFENLFREVLSNNSDLERFVKGAALSRILVEEELLSEKGNFLRGACLIQIGLENKAREFLDARPFVGEVAQKTIAAGNGADRLELEMAQTIHNFLLPKPKLGDLKA